MSKVELMSGAAAVNDHAILDGSRLDTGMKASEAIRRASRWWEKRGRQLMRQVRVAEEERRLSGILRGVSWDVLTKGEKLAVTKHWHHFAIRRPDILGLENTPFRLGGGERVQ